MEGKILKADSIQIMKVQSTIKKRKTLSWEKWGRTFMDLNGIKNQYAQGKMKARMINYKATDFFLFN